MRLHSRKTGATPRATTENQGSEAEKANPHAPKTAIRPFAPPSGRKQRVLRGVQLQAQREEVDNRVSQLQAQRDELQQQIQFFRDNGQASQADALVPRLDDINGRLSDAIERAKAFYEALRGNPEALAAMPELAGELDSIILRLETAALSTQRLGTFLGISLGTIAEQAASGATDAFDRFAQSVAQGANVFRSARDAFLSFAFDFLRQIARMIEQQLIFNLVSGILSSLGGAAGGSLSNGAGMTGGFGAMGGVMAHGGGVIGEANLLPGLRATGLSGPRAVQPEWFAAAMRYHRGGIAGLLPGEVPAVLKRGEEVLTANDPRHVANGGGQSPVNLKVVNTIDAGAMYREGLATKTGEKAFLNFIRDNAGAVRQAMSG